MGEVKSAVFLVGEKNAELERLMSRIEGGGHYCRYLSDLNDLSAVCEDDFSQIVAFSPSPDMIEDLSSSTLLKEYAAKHLLTVILDEFSYSKAIDFFRLGIADVWFEDMSSLQLEESFTRLQEFADLRLQRVTYGQRLETANLELQDSLHMLKQDQLAGLEVQKSLMPESPLSFADYEISHSVTPSLYLSGDFVGYNFVLDRYLVVYFADVSGHGASSAFVTVLLRFMIGRVIQRHVAENDHAALKAAPEGLLEHVNKQVLATGLGKHLTIVAGCLDTENSTLRYVVGAQLPRPILIVDGCAQYLPGKGKPVGIFEGASWEVEQIVLPERCALVLLSDGVFDLVPDKDLIDKEETLLRFLARSSDNLESLKAALSVDFLEDPQDDVSMCLLARGM